MQVTTFSNLQDWIILILLVMLSWGASYEELLSSWLRPFPLIIQEVYYLLAQPIAFLLLVVIT